VAVAALAAVCAASGSSGLRPAIIWKPIPMSAARLHETAAYSGRHYGVASWRLSHPKVIVEHYTANESLRSTWAAFASDAPDGELHETPGTCAHFVVDRDGRIYQLVRLGVRCRHTVGLNWTAIGIEHVGMSDAEVLGNPRQYAASIRLTLWLMRTFGISLGNVIGHNESLESPYHHERYAAWRCQTHGDFVRADMDRYRARLAAAARRAGIPLGKRVNRVPSRC
jgi:N-acetylmuramoyl-L-alanine amidase